MQKRTGSRSVLQDTPPKKSRTDFVEDMKIEVARKELEEHSEFDWENLDVKEHYHEESLADNDDGKPAKDERESYAATLEKELVNWLKFGDVKLRDDSRVVLRELVGLRQLLEWLQMREVQLIV